MTLHYPFPVISHIDDVKPHIDEHFRVVDKGEYTYINYLLQMPAVFPPVEGTWKDRFSLAVRRECRGIAFESKTGELVSRPFHKFFNLGDDSFGTPTDNPLKHPHDVLLKLDGSMVRPLPNGRWGTKMGVTDVALDAEVFVASHMKYQVFANSMISLGRTPIFEYCGPHNRVVLEYPESMTLLAIRQNTTGAYLPREDLLKVAATFGIPVVETSSANPEEVKLWDDKEGIVIFYDNGHMLKVKSDWYVKAHRAKELLHSDRRFLEAVVNQTIDDIIPAFLEDDQVKAKEKVATFERCLQSWVDVLEDHLHYAETTFDKNKRDYAIATKDYTPENLIYRQYVFQKWDLKVDNAEQFLLNRLKSAITSNRKVEEAMKELGLEL